MYCPKCGGHEGFSKVTEVSGPINLKGLDEDQSQEEIGDSGHFYNEDDYVIMCDPCYKKNIESEMGKEPDVDPPLSIQMISEED